MTEDNNAKNTFFYYKEVFYKLWRGLLKTNDFFLKLSSDSNEAMMDPLSSPPKKVFSFLGIILFFLLDIVVLIIEAVFFAALFLVVQIIYLFFGLLICGTINCVSFLSKKTILCNKCQKKIKRPAYVCPNCSVEHPDLIPSTRYGFFYWTCSCGHKLPTCNLWGKKKLEDICPHCGNTDISPINSIPHVISFVGGKNVGKTFLQGIIFTSIKQYVNQLGKGSRHKGSGFFEKIYCSILNWYENRRCLRVNIPSELKNKYMEIESKLNSGIIPDETQADQKDPPYIIDLKRGYHSVVERLYLYDVPGENFISEEGTSEYVFYEYLKTLIIVVDPLSLSNVKQQIPDVDRIDKISQVSASDCFQKWRNNMERYHTGGRLRHALQKIRCAVVITKVDIPQFKKLNLLSVNSTCQECRQFLENNGLGILVSQVESNFGQTFYCAVSCTGGQPEYNGSFTPQGIDNLLEWILK